MLRSQSRPISPASMFKPSAALLASLLALCGCAPPDATAPEAAAPETAAPEAAAPAPLGEVVATEHGKVRGAYTEDQAVLAFKGIPYAAPPLGDRRWKPPLAPASWPGEREALAFGMPCLQAPPVEGFYVQEPMPQSEDCLYLNVWTPAASSAAGLPVMVWIHGGAFIMGTGNMPLYDGENLARSGVVLVSINYRLGLMGSSPTQRLPPNRRTAPPATRGCWIRSRPSSGCATTSPPLAAIRTTSPSSANPPAA